MLTREELRVGTMSIDHKAYLFDHHGFDRELSAILTEALRQEDVSPLRIFIQRHLAELTDQGTEEPPDGDWERGCQQDGRPDVQLYADLALTKYYDCTDSLGLSHGFDALHAYLRTVPTVHAHAADLICGRLFGPKGNRLDPGRMGTGLLSPNEVQRLHALLRDTDWPRIPGTRSRIWAGCHYRPESTDEVRESLKSLRELYWLAVDEGQGLLLVDFNDSGVSGM